MNLNKKKSFKCFLQKINSIEEKISNKKNLFKIQKQIYDKVKSKLLWTHTLPLNFIDKPNIIS